MDVKGDFRVPEGTRLHQLAFINNLNYAQSIHTNNHVTKWTCLRRALMKYSIVCFDIQKYSLQGWSPASSSSRIICPSMVKTFQKGL